MQPVANDLDITVVFICCDDFRLFKAINSIDTDLPVVVSLVPNNALASRLSELKINVVYSPRGNYSASVNRGLSACKTKRAFIIDSDCLLRPGCISRIAFLLDSAPLARARVEFLTDVQIRGSESTAKFHNRVNNRLPIRPYTPGLGLRMEIIEEIGGYYFDERVFWSGDSEFSHRIANKGLQVVYDPDAVITHAAITVPHTFHSGYKLGMGTCAQVKLGLRPAYESPLQLVRRAVNRAYAFVSGRMYQGERSSAIQFIWSVGFYLGYFLASFKSVDSIGAEYKKTRPIKEE